MPGFSFLFFYKANKHAYLVIRKNDKIFKKRNLFYLYNLC